MTNTRCGARALTAGLALATGLAVAGPAILAAAAPVPAHQTRLAGAPAGPRLARFYDQAVAWHRCQAGPHDTGGRALDQAGARCANIRVPLDYTRPGGRTITVAISRLGATAPAASRLGPLIINLGGPGLPVRDLIPLARQAMGATGARFDLIGMDQRFAGRSTPLNCRWPDNWLPRGAGRSRASFGEMVRISRDLAARCARQAGSVLPFAGTANAARDMDVIRAVLGAPKLNYLGYSYGTYLGALYTQLFGGNAGRVVLDSAIDPARPGVAKADDGPIREAALRDWSAWAARRDGTYHLGRTPRQVLRTVYGVYRAAGEHPLGVGPFRVDGTVIPAVLLDPLSDDQPVSSAELAADVRSLNLAAHGRPARPSADLEAALAGQLTGAVSALHSEQTAIMCADAAVPRDPAVYWRAIAAHRASAPLFSPVDQTITPCAFWPFHPGAVPVVASHVPALIVNADGDINANVSLARALHRDLSASRLIVAAHTRTHGVYLFRQNACVDDAVNHYLDTGVLPARDFVCR